MRTTKPEPGPDFLELFLGIYYHDPAVGILRAAEAELVAGNDFPRPFLDLGCGDGSFLAATVPDAGAIGLDRDWKRAKRALATGAYAAVVLADAHRLPFKDGAFATALANSTLEHIAGDGEVLTETQRTLTPGGRLLFTLHNEHFATRIFFWPGFFAAIGRPGLTARYRRARLQRLGMENVMRADEWRELLNRSGFRTAGVTEYLRGGTNELFEKLLVLGRFGIGRVHIGSFLRLLGQFLSATGLTIHRRLAGRFLARLLRSRCGAGVP